MRKLIMVAYKQQLPNPINILRERKEDEGTCVFGNALNLSKKI